MDDTLRIQSVADMHGDVLEYQEDLHRRCFLKDDAIILNGSYHVALKRCDTYPKILGWLDHLSGKTWFEADMMGRFIHLVCDHHGLPIDRNS